MRISFLCSLFVYFHGHNKTIFVFLCWNDLRLIKSYVCTYFLRQSAIIQLFNCTKWTIQTTNEKKPTRIRNDSAAAAVVADCWWWCRRIHSARFHWDQKRIVYFLCIRFISHIYFDFFLNFYEGKYHQLWNGLKQHQRVIYCVSYFVFSLIHSARLLFLHSIRSKEWIKWNQQSRKKRRKNKKTKRYS